MAEEIVKTLDEMTNDEVISVITINRDNYNDKFREKAEKELINRGVNIDDVFKECNYKLNEEEFVKIKLEEGASKLEELKSVFDLIYFQNYMHDHLAVQKLNGYYSLHYHNRKEGFTSVFIETKEDVANSVNKFLSLENWIPEGVEVISHWETFIESGSKSYIERVSKLLNEIEIPHCINSPLLVRFASFNSPYAVVMPSEYIEDARDIYEALEDIQNELHEKLEQAESRENTKEQLEILIELESVTPDDPVLYYNKAQLQDELGDYEGAVESAIESFNIDLAKGEVEDINDIEEYLQSKLDKVEKKGNVLHCLASIASFKNEIDTAMDLYNQILAIDEKDSIAHLNLGHFYFSHTEEDEKIKFHFNKFVELNPESEEIETIEEILKNIG